jgi:magnesium chelatase accessory protein
LMVGAKDRTVPPVQGPQVLQRLSPAAQGRCISLPGLGHLAHEEQPELVAGHIVAAFEASLAASA